MSNHAEDAVKRLFVGVGMALGLGLAQLNPVRAEPWKRCWFNDQPIGCRDQHHADGSLTIRWSDGLAMTYRPMREGFPRSSLRDSLGGLWEREVLAQGNAVLTHAENGNRIVVPLRPEAAAECPEPVQAKIAALYRWQLERQDQPGSIAISSQRQRFTPALFALLEQAYGLTPADGRFVDFDLFSGTQVQTYGATLLGCSPAKGGQLMARVAVQAGLRGRPAEPPKQLLYLMEPSGAQGWRIANIVYPGEPTFDLSTYLQQLVQPQR